MISRHTKKGEIGRIDSFFISPEGRISQQSLPILTKDLKKIKESVIIRTKEAFEEYCPVEMKEENLDFDNFEQSFSWLMQHPKLMQIICD